MQCNAKPCVPFLEEQSGPFISGFDNYRLTAELALCNKIVNASLHSRNVG